MGSIASTPSFSIKEEPVENLRPIKVRVIGAGFSGIYLGIRIPERIRNVDLKIYDKNDEIGGTWWENRYPGCACDIPSHSYQYSFEPNPNWSAFYAPAPEICDYLQGVAKKYNVNRFIKTSHKIEHCQWDENAKKWSLTIRNLKTNEVFVDDANILIAARGALNDIAWPQIPGFQSFKGEVMHSAAWNQDYDFKNKRVGVIGGGSSSIQIVPSLQKVEGIHLSTFVRSKTWISNPFGDASMQKMGLDINQLTFSEEQQSRFKTDTDSYLKFRKTIEADGNTIHEISIRNSNFSKDAFQQFSTQMRQRLAKKPEIAEMLLPTFSVACRRLTPGPGYLEALVADNVDFISQKIEEITPNGIKLKGGTEIELDALVCATGFNTGAPPPFTVTGKNGTRLEEKFKPYPQTYLAMAVDSFPNYFMMLGPNASIGTGSLTMILESQGDYIVKCIRKLQKEDYASMEIKPERVADFTEYVGEYFKRTVYLDNCHSWYRSEGGKGDRIVGLWPGSTLHALETLRAPRWEDFDYEGADQQSNRLRWLGNGYSLTQTKGDPAWYLDPAVVDVPKAGEPENSDIWKPRPFSH